MLMRMDIAALLIFGAVAAFFLSIAGAIDAFEYKDRLSGMFFVLLAICLVGAGIDFCLRLRRAEAPEQEVSE